MSPHPWKGEGLSETLLATPNSSPLGQRDVFCWQLFLRRADPLADKATEGKQREGVTS